MGRQKNAAPTREQQAALKKAGLDPLYWEIARELPLSLVVHNRQTGEWRMIGK